MDKLLQNLYLFRGLEQDQLARFEEIAESEFYPEGEFVFVQGEPADAFFVIQHGAVTIGQNDEDDSGERIDVATLGTGSHFGEMSFLDNTPRSANALAVSDSHVLRIRYDAMATLLESDGQLALQVYRELARFLCGRLRLTTLDLTFERSQNLGHF